MKNATIFLLMLCCGLLLRGQSLTVTQATSERWASGACCSQGVSYAFVLQPDARTKSFVLDSLWVGSSLFLPKADAQSPVQCRFDPTTGNYQIYAGLAWGLPEMMLDVPVEAVEVEERHYDGAALIACHINGRKQQIIVPQMSEIFSPPRP